MPALSIKIKKVKMDLEASRKENKERYRQMAVTYWENAKNGIYPYFDKKRHDMDFIEEQIKFFKEMKI